LSPHQKAIEKIVKDGAFWKTPQFKSRFFDFAKGVERRGINVRIKEKHHEGDFDVGIYHGDNLQGWFGLAFNPKLNCLAIESVQGEKLSTSHAFREKISSTWYSVLANRVITTVLRNGEHRVALVNWEKQESAKHNPSSSGIYSAVGRALKKRAKKAVVVSEGKYTLYYLP